MSHLSHFNPIYGSRPVWGATHFTDTTFCDILSLMSSSAELPQEPVHVDELFTELHSQAYEVAKGIPTFDRKRGGPDLGEIYCHRNSWEHPSHHMPVTETMVRIAEEHSAPYLLGLWTLHPEDQPDTVLPCQVETYNHTRGGNEVEIERQRPSGLIEVRLGAVWDEGEDLQDAKRGYYPASTRMDKLPLIDKERLDITAKSILGIVGALRHFLTLDISERPAALAELDLPTLLISSEAKQEHAADPRLVEMQVAIAQAHPELAEEVFSLDLSDPETHFVLALGDGIINGRIEVDLSGESVQSNTTSASADVIAKLAGDLLEASDFPERNN